MREHRFHHFGHFCFGFPGFGFYFHSPRHFPGREAYLRMLEEYKEELEAELREVERKIEELRKEK